MDDYAHTKDIEPTAENIAKAIYTVNRHAKTAPNPKFLYLLKNVRCKNYCKKVKEEKWAYISLTIPDIVNNSPTC